MNTIERVARISIWFLSILLLLFGLGLLPSIGHALPTSRDLKIKIADRKFELRNVPKNARAALSMYEELAKDGLSEPALAWRIAMANYFVGLRVETDNSKRKDHYDRGRRVARRALKWDQSCAPCHFWAAVNTALYGESIGTLGAAILLLDVRSHLDAVIELNDSYASGGAYRILGLIEEKLPSTLGGSKAKAEEYFRKAILVAPDEAMNYLYLAKLLHKHFPGRRDEAIKVAAIGLARPAPSAGNIESAEARLELEHFLSNASQERLASN